MRLQKKSEAKTLATFDAKIKPRHRVAIASVALAQRGPVSNANSGR
jgi:hypothetical protein